MREAAEDDSFALETLFTCVAKESEVEKLDCDFALEPAIVTLGKPYGAHASLADLRYDGVGAKRLPGQGADIAEVHGEVFKEAVASKIGMITEQRLEVFGDSGI